MANLRAPEHQVAGHQARYGELAPLIDDSGHFYKPFPDEQLGSNEESFYTSLFTNTKIPKHILKFFPAFHGTQLLQSSDGSGLRRHLVLQDLTANYHHPSVIDFKIGSRTWYPKSSEDYMRKCFKKDIERTSLELGFRVSGLQVYESEKTGFWRPDRKYVRNFTVVDVGTVLRKFVSSNPCSESQPDCLFASDVYGGCNGILAQLLELKAWIEDQTVFQFNSCSVLMLYEKEDTEMGKPFAEVKLVDFAHAAEGEGAIDHNFLGGLCSLIKFVSDIVRSCSGENIIKSGLQGSEKN